MKEAEGDGSITNCIYPKGLSPIFLVVLGPLYEDLGGSDTLFSGTYIEDISQKIEITKPPQSINSILL